MDKIIFLDRDGVINKKAEEHDYIKSWDEFEFIDGVAEFIRELNIMGYKVIVITNQRGISLGKLSPYNLENIHAKMLQILESKNAYIEDIFVCSHDIGKCSCRKPDTGLFLRAEEKYEIDKTKSFMIGDSESDILAGMRYGVKSILFGEKKDNVLYCYDNFSDLLKFISRHNK